jgi:steroid delta-isomerase-like uncharacterized protein
MGKARDVVEAAFRAWNAGDLDAMLKDYDDNATFWSTARPEGLGGKAQVREYCQLLFNAFPGVQIKIANLIESGDKVAVEYKVSGTHGGPLVTGGRTIPATGKPIEGQGADFLEVRNGRIVSERIYADNLELMRQLGLMPAAASAN